jgi:hypothetical protein
MELWGGSTKPCCQLVISAHLLKHLIINWRFQSIADLFINFGRCLLMWDNFRADFGLPVDELLSPALITVHGFADVTVVDIFAMLFTLLA